MRLPTLRTGARILFITNTRIGDAVLSTGLLGLLIDRFPTARITIVVGPLAISLFDDIPGVERVIALRKRQYNTHWLSLYFSLLRSWDLIVDLRGSATAWLVPTRHRRVISRSDPTKLRVVELAQLLDVDPPPPPRLWLQERDRQAASQLVPVDTGFIAIAPGASSEEKRWPADRFAAMVDRLVRHDAIGRGLAIVLLGGAEERQHIDAIRGRMSTRDGMGHSLAIVGEERLPVVAAILERAQLFIGNDSGLMHLAAASGAPTVGLFGPTPPARYRPWGERTLVVQPDGCIEGGHDQTVRYWAPRPIADLSVERVVDCVTRFAVKRHLVAASGRGCQRAVQ